MQYIPRYAAVGLVKDIHAASALILLDNHDSRLA